MALSRGLSAVLVVSGGGFQGLAVARLLGEADGFRVVVADVHSTGPSAPLADRFLRVPPVSDRSSFLSALVAACRDEEVRLVLPATDHELELLAAERSRFEAATGARVAVCDAGLLARLRDKERLYRALPAAGLPVLAPCSPEDGALPLVGKPRQGWGGRGVVVVRERGELLALAAAERERRVWQPFLDGAEEVSADFAIRRDGKVPAVGLRRRVRTSAGFAVVSDTVLDAEAEALVRRFASWAASEGGWGLFNVQLLRRGDQLVVSDVNPRLGTSAVHWRGSGFNPTLVLCAEAGLAPEGAGSAAPSSLLRSIRCLDEVFVPTGPGEPVDGVVFDLDDTLVPTKRWQCDRLDRALDEIVGGAERDHARREGRRILEEGPRPRLLDALAEAMGWDAGRHEALTRAYERAWPEACPTFPDVRPALDSLRRRGLRLGLLTDNPPATQRRKLEASGLVAFLDAVVYAREAGAEKPDRRGFERVAAALGIPPGRLAMAGDNPHRDLAGAAAAGYARLFWVRRPGAASSFDEELSRGLAGADRFEPVADLRQLALRLAG